MSNPEAMKLINELETQYGSIGKVEPDNPKLLLARGLLDGTIISSYNEAAKLLENLEHEYKSFANIPPNHPDLAKIKKLLKQRDYKRNRKVSFHDSYKKTRTIIPLQEKETKDLDPRYLKPCLLIDKLTGEVTFFKQLADVGAYKHHTPIWGLQVCTKETQEYKIQLLNAKEAKKYEK